MSNLADVLRQAMDNKIADVHTSIPCEVVSFNSNNASCSVRPVIRKRYMDGRVSEPPVISSVPVQYPRTSNASITFPISRGDKGILVFSERSIDEYLATGRVSTPSDRRKHDFNDAFFIPGAFDLVNGGPIDTDGLKILNQGHTIRINNDGSIILDNNDSTLLISPSGSLSFSNNESALLISPSGSLSFANSVGAFIDLGDDGLIAIGNQQEELLSYIEELTEALTQASVATMLGPQQFLNLADFLDLLSRIPNLKG